jgi:hypothetical protein
MKMPTCLHVTCLKQFDKEGKDLFDATTNDLIIALEQ